MTQEDLAEASGLSVPYISNLEREVSANTRSGKPRASEKACGKLARALGVPEDQVRREAGWLPKHLAERPRTIKDLIERFKELGLDLDDIPIQGYDVNSPDDKERMLDDLYTAIVATLSRPRRRPSRLFEIPISNEQEEGETSEQTDPLPKRRAI